MKHQPRERSAIFTGLLTVYRHIAFPLPAFDYLKKFQSEYKVSPGSTLTTAKRPLSYLPNISAALPPTL